jgi:hypothetical protein
MMKKGTEWKMQNLKCPGINSYRASNFVKVSNFDKAELRKYKTLRKNIDFTLS